MRSSTHPLLRTAVAGWAVIGLVTALTADDVIDTPIESPPPTVELAEGVEIPEGVLASESVESVETIEPLESDAEVVQGVVEAVTLYRDQALVTRRIEIPAGEGIQEIRVGRLPEQVISESVYAEGDADTEVRAVRVGRQASTASARQDVAKLEAKIAKLKQQHDDIRVRLEVNAKAVQDIDRLTQFSLNTGAADLGRGVLDAEALTKLVTFAAESRDKLSEAGQQLRRESEKIEDEIEQAESELGLLTEFPKQTSYEAKLTVRSATGGQVRLSYLVAECGWSPSYTIHGDWADHRITLKYSAMVRQMTGENWPDARLTLSTASPQISSSGPVLIPFRVSVGTPAPFGDSQSAAVPQSNQEPGTQLKEAAKGLRKRQASAESSLGPAVVDRAGEIRRDLMLNSIAGRMQGLEFQADAQEVASLAVDDATEVDSQTYLLEEPVSLDSRREYQLVKIIESTFDAEVYHIAQPLLSSFAYRQAEVTNALDIGLLGGPATVYLDDRFVGRAPLPTTASGQKLTIGLGADQQVRTRRELMNKRDEMQGGNRRLHFEYRLVVANFKSDPVKLRLVDRIPVAEDPKAVSIRLDPTEQPLSTDPLYLRIERPRGILRWDLEVAGASFGSDAFDVDYTYSVEFDRSMQILTDSDETGLFDDTGSIHPNDRILFERGMGGMGGMMGGGM